MEYYITQEKDYWIHSSALSITLNALGNPNRIQCSVSSGAVIRAFYENVNADDTLGYNAAHSYKSWPLSASPTYFNSDTAKYVYVAIPRTTAIGTQAVVVFPSEKLDIYGKNADEAQIGSNDYLYIYIGGHISATDGTSNRTWVSDPREHTGKLGTDQGEREAQNDETEWYSYARSSGIVTFLKKISMPATSWFQNLRLGTSDSNLTGVATADTSDEYVDSETIVVTPSYLNNKYLSKTHSDTAAGYITFLKGLRSVGDAIIDGLLTAYNAVINTLQSDNYTGDGMADTGFRLTSDDGTGSSKLTVDNLYVRKKATFEELEVKKETAIAGNQVYSCAANVILRTDYLDENGATLGYSTVIVPWLVNKIPFLLRGIFYGRLRKVRIFLNADDVSKINRIRCYFLAKDDKQEVDNLWHEGDLARCQTMNLNKSARQTFISDSVSHTGNVFWWRKVLRGGNSGGYQKVMIDEKEYHYFDVSMSDCASGSDIPAAGDHVVQFGNDRNTDRMNVKITEVNGGDAPADKYYLGIYTYSLEKCWWGGSPRKAMISPKSGYEFYGPHFKLVQEYGVTTVSIDRGEWSKIAKERDDYKPHAQVIKCYYWDKVTHNGRYWQCVASFDGDGAHWVNTNGNYITEAQYNTLSETDRLNCTRKQDYTTVEPGTNDAVWIILADKGDNMVRLDIDNEMDMVPTDSTGKVTANRTVSTVVTLYDGAAEEALGSLTVDDIAYTDDDGQAQTLQPTTATTGNSIRLSWAFQAGWVIAAGYNVHITYSYNDVTYRATFTIAASMGQPIYQLKPSRSSIPFQRNSNNALTPASRAVSLTVVKIDGASTQELDAPVTGLTIRYSFTEMPAQPENGTAWPSTDSVSVTNDKENLYIALFDYYGNMIDRESIPVVKDGENGENADQPMTAFKWLTIGEDTTPSSITLPTNGNYDNGWTATAHNRPTTAGEHFLWVTQTMKHTTKAGTISYDDWSSPVRISGNTGDAGEDASDREYIYIRSNDYPFSGTQPSAVTTGEVSPDGAASGSDTNRQQDDWVPNGWCDTALAVEESAKYVYMAVRAKSAGKNQQWGDFSDAFLWNNWGEKGMDGDGVQYVYKLYASKLTDAQCSSYIPTKPASQNENGEWLPAGRNSNDPNTVKSWTDDPESTNSDYPFCYCSIIKRINGTWGSYEKLALWSTYTESSVRLALDNEHEDFLYNDNGDLISPSGGATSNIRLYDGSQEITNFTPVIDNSTTGATASINGKELTISALTAESGEVVVKVTYKETPYYARFTANKVHQDKYDLVAKPNAIAFNASETWADKTISLSADRTDLQGNKTSGVTIQTTAVDGLRLYYSYVNSDGSLFTPSLNRVGATTFTLLEANAKAYIGVYFELRLYSGSTYRMCDYETVEIAKTENGEAGNGISSITRTYARSTQSTSANDTTVPTGIDTTVGTGGWAATSPAVTEAYPYLWAKEVVAYTKSAATTKYYCIGARGDNGVDAQDVEWAYIRTKTDTAPAIANDTAYTDSNGNGYTADDHLPHVTSNSNIENNEGTYECTDDPRGVNDTWKYEWEIKRTKGDATNGKRTWNAYSGTMTLRNSQPLSITSANVWYALTQSGTNEPADSAFTLDDFPTTLNAGYYVWEATKVIYSTGSSELTGKICLGPTTDFLSGTEVYAVSTSNTNPPAETEENWKTTYEKTKGSYLWSATRVQYTNGTYAYLNKKCIGYWGTDGTSITKKSETYRYATNNTGTRPAASSSDWSTTKPTLQQGYWLYTETTITWSDGNTTVLYTDERNPNDGIAGQDIIVDRTEMKYAVSTSNTQQPTTWFDYAAIASQIVAGTWLWCQATTYYKKATTDESAGSSVNYSVSYNGTNGLAGRAMTGNTEHYNVSNSSSTSWNVPSSGTWSGEWTTDPNVPDSGGTTKWNANAKYLWNYEKITYTESDSSTTIARTTPRVIAIWTKDGKGIDSITNHYAISASGTTVPDKSQTGAQGWDDNPITPNATYPYLWNYETIAWTDGSTPTETTPHVIGHYGKDGTSPWVADLDNEMDSVSCDETGHPVKAQDVGTVVALYEGNSAKPFVITSVTRKYGDGNNASEVWTASASQAVNGVYPSWAGGELTIHYTADAIITGKDEFVIILRASTDSSVIRSLTLTVNGVIGDVYNLKPSESQVRIAAADTTYSGLACGYTKNVDGTVTDADDVTERIDGKYNIYFRRRVRSTGTWEQYGGIDRYYLYTSYKSNVALLAVNTYDAVEFILCTDTGAYVSSPTNVIDRETVPVVSDGANGDTPVKGVDYNDGEDGWMIAANPANVILTQDLVTASTFPTATVSFTAKKGSRPAYVSSIGEPVFTNFAGQKSGTSVIVQQPLANGSSYHTEGRFSVQVNVTDPDDTSKTVDFTVIVPCYANLLGSWKQSVEDGVETSVATKMGFADDGSAVTQLSWIGEYIRGWAENTSVLTETVKNANRQNLFGFSKGVIITGSDWSCIPFVQGYGIIINHRYSNSTNYRMRARVQNLGFSGLTGWYTVSFQARSMKSSRTVNVNLCDTEGTLGMGSLTTNTYINVTSAWKAFTLYFNIADGNSLVLASSYNGFIDFEAEDSIYASGEAIAIRHLMIERGQTDGTFCPADEDITYTGRGDMATSLTMPANVNSSGTSVCTSSQSGGVYTFTFPKSNITSCTYGHLKLLQQTSLNLSAGKVYTLTFSARISTATTGFFLSAYLYGGSPAYLIDVYDVTTNSGRSAYRPTIAGSTVMPGNTTADAYEIAAYDGESRVPLTNSYVTHRIYLYSQYNITNAILELRMMSQSASYSSYIYAYIKDISFQEGYVMDTVTYSSLASQTARRITMSVDDGLAQTGIDIANRKIQLRADKVEFTDSTGTIKDKVWIDPATGVINAVDGVFTGTVMATNFYHGVVFHGEESVAYCTLAFLDMLNSEGYERYVSNFSVGGYYTNAEIRNLTGGQYGIGATGMVVCTGSADIVVIKSSRNNTGEQDIVLPIASDYSGKIVEIIDTRYTQTSTSYYVGGLKVSQADNASVMKVSFSQESSIPAYIRLNGNTDHNGGSYRLISYEGYWVKIDSRYIE